MSEYYTKAFFKLNATISEIAVLKELDEFDPETEQLRTEPSKGFLETFKPIDSNLLSGFLHYIEDRELDGIFEFADMLVTDGTDTYISSWNIDLHTLSNILQCVCPSALPIAFTWSTDCSTYRDEDDFGGGVTVIEANQISGWSSFAQLDEVRARLSIT